LPILNLNIKLTKKQLKEIDLNQKQQKQDKKEKLVRINVLQFAARHAVFFKIYFHSEVVQPVFF